MIKVFAHKYILAEGPGVARGKKNFEKKNLKKNECPHKISAQSVQPAIGNINECLVLLYR